MGEMDTQREMNEKIVYTLDKNYCKCHPETCNCFDYAVYENGVKYFTLNDKIKGEHIVKALNFFENNKNLVNKLKTK
ncbi:MAG: hypothetical protein M1416_00125 [Candidatus Pacearchaeota archaeon]|nr:hypothetical protein [Candidatus Pacearchaeota archaeon]